ncbi:MAG: peptidoglycan editing factor PgeF [Sulfurovaceae bacterium]|nr:peptidoglycan editing factor PgeF [Sulfurovaceae bacterium]
MREDGTLFSNFSAYPSLVHLITQKNLTKEYTFSLALHTDENPQKILQNRATIQAKFPNMKFIVGHQTHSDNIETIKSRATRGWENQESVIQDCDAFITNQKGIMLTILTADCVPILLFDPKQNIIGVVHAGWRGTKQEIVLKTVQKMQQEFGTNPQDIIAGVAPSIGRCCYEVGEDVAKHFFNDSDSFTQKDKKFMLDLPYLNKMQLLKAGLHEDNIEMSAICTACEVEYYFSYRKEQGCSGRFMSMIGLT